MSTVCVDSGFIIALYDQRDQHHSKAKEIFKIYFNNRINKLIVPWPILYESVSTRMVRDPKRMGIFKKDWELLSQQNQLHTLDDQKFREKALRECLSEVTRGQHYRALSLTDRVIRLILAEINIKIDIFISFNIGDFSDVCKKYRREIHNS